MVAGIEAVDESFEDALAEPEATTETEDDRDEARRLTALLEKQLLQLQQEAARTQTKMNEQAAALKTANESAAAGVVAAQQAAAVTANTGDPAADLWRAFEAEPSQLPVLGTASPQELKTLQQLAALFAAVSWGAQLPALRVDCLGVAPSFVHFLVGDTIWKACWLEIQAAIIGQHWIPYRLLSILKSVIEQNQFQPAATQLEEGK